MSAGGLLKNRFSQKFVKAAGKLAAFSVLGLVAAFAGFTQAQENGQWRAGRFSFSDELGGFSITGVTGTGTRRNPYVIQQTFDTAEPATLVIRTHRMDDVAKLPNNNITHSAIHVLIVTRNNSNLPWIGFGFELQEQKDVASTYGDGLSFDQLGRSDEDIYSNRFAAFEDEFEPGDRLVYTNGFVDDQSSVSTQFVITDFTPVPQFYLYQDPMVPAS